MKFPLRSPLFWLVALLFAGLTVWWTLHVPYAPEQVWKAIPAEAVFVSEHRDRPLGDAFSHNPRNLNDSRPDAARAAGSVE